MTHEWIATLPPRRQQTCEQPVDEIKRVNRADFGDLYRTHVMQLYRYFYHHIGNVHDAEDLTAMTMSKALANLDRYEGRGTFAAWLFSIARHTLVDNHRQYRPTIDLLSVRSTHTDPAPSPESEAVQADQAYRLNRLLKQLPSGQHDALALRYFAGLRTAEIAAVLGRSEGAVKQLIHRALVTLRGTCQQEEY